MKYSVRICRVRCRWLLSALAAVLVINAAHAADGLVTGQATNPLTTRFSVKDRPPDFTVYEDVARSRGAFHQVVTGDFNGDGIADLLVTNSLANGSSQQGAGGAYVILGKRSLGSSASTNLANAEPDLTILGSGQFLQLGFNATAGDLNGDGIDDIVLCSISSIYLVFGSRTFDRKLIDLSHSAADVTINGQIVNGISPGLAVGDINGDGSNDLIFGLHADGPGSVAALFGPFVSGDTINLATTAPDVLLTGRGALDGFGFGLVAADVNGDGVSDLVIGSPFIGRDQGVSAGVVDVFMGSPNLRSGMRISLLHSTSDAIILGAFGGSESGDGVGRLIWRGDVNGDRIDDILLGVPGSTRLDNGLGRTSAGDIYVVFGSPSLAGRVIDVRAGQQDLTIQGAAATIQMNSSEWGDTLGSSIAAKDIDGDGVTDILIGAPGAGGKKDPGQAYVVLGSPELTSGTLIRTSDGDEDIAIFGQENFAHLGIVVASGDLNGDGVSDIILEAPDAETPGGSQQGTGAIYVYFGANVQPPVVTKAKFKEGKSQLLIFGTEFTGDLRVEVNGVTINREVTFLPDDNQVIVKGNRQELNLIADLNQVVVLRKGKRSNAARVKG